MDRTDSRAGQHRIGGFRHHGHVNANAIAGAHPSIMHNIGETTDLVFEHLIANVLAFARIIPFPQYGGLLSTGGQVRSIQLTEAFSFPPSNQRAWPMDKSLSHTESQVLSQAVSYTHLTLPTTIEV